MSWFQGTVAQSELGFTCSAQVLSYITSRGEDAQDKRSRRAWIEDEVETEALNTILVQFKYLPPQGCRPYIIYLMAYHDIVLCHLLRPKRVHKPQHYAYGAPLHVHTTRIIHTRHDYYHK
jgi:hypothetical protein